MHNKEQMRLVKRLIQRIFLEEWDPIGIRKYPEAEDEYDAYIGGMYVLLKSDAPDDEIITYLQQIETERMGLHPTDKSRLADIVSSLKRLHIPQTEIPKP
jgi:hypothetical protein